MKNLNVTFGLAVGACLLMTACGHQTENEIDRKVAAESNINSAADLNAESTKVLMSSSGLSDAQRAKLVALQQQTRQETEIQNKEALRLRAVLAKEMLAETYDRREVRLLKKKIIQADQKKTDILMSAVQQANLILGRTARDHRDLFDFDQPVRESGLR